MADEIKNNITTNTVVAPGAGGGKKPISVGDSESVGTASCC